LARCAASSAWLPALARVPHAWLSAAKPQPIDAREPAAQARPAGAA
jgi:hypothetical protein